MSFRVPRAVQPRHTRSVCGALLACTLLMTSLLATAEGNAIRRTFHFRSIGAEQGLAQNTIGAFLQDRQGFLWIGTESGLQKYDGYEFLDYAQLDDSTDGALERPISALAEDADGTLWVGSVGAGLLRKHAASERFDRVDIGPDTGSVSALLADPERGIWVATTGRILLLDAGSGALRHTYPFANAAEPPATRQIERDDDGALWIAGSQGIWRLAPGADAPERIGTDQISAASRILVRDPDRVYAATPRGLYRVTAGGNVERIWPADGEEAVSALAEDGNGRFWLALPRNGFALFDPSTGATQRMPPDPLEGGVSDAIVNRLHIDRSGLLWIGTYERGLIRVDPRGTAFTHVLMRKEAPREGGANYVHAISEAEDGNLWLGTERGLLRYLPRSNEFEEMDAINAAIDPARDGSTRRAIRSIVPADRMRLWIATSHGVAAVDPQARKLAYLPLDPTGTAGLGPGPARALARARDGGLWIGMRRAGLVRYDARTYAFTTWREQAADGVHGGLSDDAVLSVFEDRHGRIWSANMSGLNLVDPASGKVRVFRHVPGDTRSLSASLVRTIHETADGELWFGTQSGLNRLDSLDAGGARFTRWTQREGMPGATVYGISSDAFGRIWISTNRGIASLERGTGTLHSYDLGDGLQDMEFNANAVATLRDTRIAFGGINGFNLFLPQTIVASRYDAPVAITRAHAGPDDASIPITADGVRMHATDHIVRFQFASLDFAAPQRNRFAYRLEGFDKEWVNAGRRREATYTNLSPGTYTLQVRGTNRDGYWSSQVASMTLDVVPPWWNNRIAHALYALAALGLLAVAWLHRRSRQRMDEVHTLGLREREDRLRLAVWGSGDDFWDWDMVTNTIVVTGASGLFGTTDQSQRTLDASWFGEHLHPDDREPVLQLLQKHIDRVADNFESEHRLRVHDDEWRWSLARGRIVARDESGRPLRMCGTARDITHERLVEHDRRVANEVIHSMGEAVAVTDAEHRFINVNPAFTRITGWRREEVVGRAAALLDCTQHPPEHYSAIREDLARTGHWRGELWQRRRNGEEFLGRVEISEVRDSEGKRTHFVTVLSDITDRKRAEQELRYLANYDALTGLPNRTLVTERIGHAIIRARRSNRKVAVLFLDLDRFKHVNDSMGHAAGDRMLKAAGSRLRHVVRESDSVARLGGDEFTVVLENIGSAAEAERVAQKIIVAFEQPLELDNGQEVVISPSIGIALHPDHGQVPSDLLKFADTAMYQAKDHGRKTWMVYTEAMDAAARLRATTVAALRKALERNELSLVFQPKLSLLDERITGVEALLRWRSGDLGDVSPGVFIPIAEETGMIIEIGDWVVEQACAQLAKWREQGIHEITMSINVSVAQLLRGDLIRRLCDVLADYDIAPNQLELELTESMVMANAEQSITTLRRLKSIGLTLAIDDFGTGYSSLSYLKRLPIDTLKIDKEFVGDITTDPDDEAITATVITMAHSLGLNVIAEGVESAEQVDYLREQDCDEVQGHWLSRPLSADQCLAFLREHSQRANRATN